MDEKRWNNTDSIEIYLAHAGDPRRLHVGVEDLPVREQMEEMMFLGLRMMEGVRRGVSRDVQEPEECRDRKSVV